MEINQYLNPLDVDALTQSFASAEPFQHAVIPQLLRPEFLREICAAYPSYTRAKEIAHTEFRRVNENLKLQVTDAARFPEPVRTLHEVLASEEFRAHLSRVTGIPDLLADATLNGGGMHVMGPGGRLDVHVDFNVLSEARLYRRLNILVYLCEEWDPSWGGAVDIWDRDVTECAGRIEPDAGRMLIFATGRHSWHGVTPITCPQGRTRNSFAAYYYTEAPPADAETAHSTVFRPRPDEHWRSRVLLPLQAVGDAVRRAGGAVRRRIGGR